MPGAGGSAQQSRAGYRESGAFHQQRPVKIDGSVQRDRGAFVRLNLHDAVGVCIRVFLLIDRSVDDHIRGVNFFGDCGSAEPDFRVGVDGNIFVDGDGGTPVVGIAEEREFSGAVGRAAVRFKGVVDCQLDGGGVVRSQNKVFHGSEIEVAVGCRSGCGVRAFLDVARQFDRCSVCGHAVRRSGEFVERIEAEVVTFRNFRSGGVACPDGIDLDDAHIRIACIQVAVHGYRGVAVAVEQRDILVIDGCGIRTGVVDELEESAGFGSGHVNDNASAVADVLAAELDCGIVIHPDFASVVNGFCLQHGEVLHRDAGSEARRVLHQIDIAVCNEGGVGQRQFRIGIRLVLSVDILSDADVVGVQGGAGNRQAGGSR